MASPSFSNILMTLKPDLLIYDLIESWPETIASTHNIPVAKFLTSSAATCSFFTHLYMSPNDEYPFPALYLRNFELAKMDRFLKSSSSDSQQNDHERQSPFKSCKFILIKSSSEIERKYIDYFSSLIKKKVITVGPLVHHPISKDQRLDVIEWLAKKNHSSTLFVSFGSEYFLSKEDMEEIADGLELSNVNFIWVIYSKKKKNFIWVIRFPVGDETKVEEALPEEFLDRVRDRGMIINGWAPQAKILTHSCIGGFVSHCGWNSVTESIEFGVPIIAIPMHYDQPLNARLVVDIGLGMEVRRDYCEKLHRQEVAKVIKDVIADNKGEDMRRKARELRENIRLKGEEEINVAVGEISQLCHKSKAQ